MILSGQEILKLVHLRDVMRMLRATQAYRGTRMKARKGRDRSLGPKDRVNSIHNLRRAVNKGFVYTNS